MTIEYSYIISKDVIPSVVVLNCSLQKTKHKQTNPHTNTTPPRSPPLPPNYRLYCRPGWWQRTSIPFAFLHPWCNLDYTSLYYRSSYFYSYDNFPARFLMLVWFYPVELIKWPQCLKSTSFFCSHQWIFFLSPPIHATIFYKWLSLWYLLQDAAAFQLHLSFAFNIHKVEYASNLTV